MGMSTAVTVIPMLVLLNLRLSPAAMISLATLVGVTISINGPNIRAVLQDVCIPETRGTAFAFFNLTDDIGKGGGPVLVAALIRGLGGHRRFLSIRIRLQ